MAGKGLYMGISTNPSAPELDESAYVATNPHTTTTKYVNNGCKHTNIF